MGGRRHFAFGVIMGAYSSFYCLGRGFGSGKIRIFRPFLGKIRISREKIEVSAKK